MRIARRRFWVAVKKSAAAWRAVVHSLLKSPSLGVDVVGPVAPGQHRWSAREARPKIFPPRRDPKTRLGGRVLGLHHRSASPPLRRYNSQTCTPPPANIQGVPCKASKCTHFTHLIINIILFIFGLFVAVLGRRRPPEQPASPPDARSTKNEHRCTCRFSTTALEVVEIWSQPQHL